HTRWLEAWPQGDPWMPGGVSVPLALASAVALQERMETFAEDTARLRGLTDTIRERVAQLEGGYVIGDPARRLPHVGTVAMLASAVGLQERMETFAEDTARLRGLTDTIRERVAQLEDVYVIGDPDRRLPHVVTLAFMYLDGEPVVTGLDREGIAVGSGSACGT